MKLLPFLTFLLALIEVLREHKLFTEQSQKLSIWTILLMAGALISAILTYNGQVQADKDTAYYKSQFEQLQRNTTEVSNQLSGGDGYAFVVFRPEYEPKHNSLFSEYVLSCQLFTRSEYKLENVAVELRERFKEMGVDDKILFSARLDGSIKKSPRDTLGGRNYFFDEINSVPVIRSPIAKSETALFFKVTIKQFNATIYQTTIMRRIKEKKIIESYRWVVATLIEDSSGKLHEELVDPEFPLAKDGKPDWNTGWDSPT